MTKLADKYEFMYMRAAQPECRIKSLNNFL